MGVEDDELDTAQYAVLQRAEKAGPEPFVLGVSGIKAEDLPAPVVLNAWGLQLQLEDAADERVGVFLQKYVRGPQTVEPGAPCSGGTGTPE